MIENGNNLNIRIDDVVIPSLTNVSASFSSNNLVVTTQPTNGQTERIPGVTDGSLSFDGYFDSSVLVLNIGDLIEWSFLGRGREFTGMGYVFDLDRSGGTDEVPKLSGTILTTGQISSFEVNINEALCDLDLQLCDAGEDLFTLL